MAFDMYFDGRREAIRYDEEGIFSMASSAPESFPVLCFIGSHFYGGFSLSPEQAGSLVHELLSLYRLDSGSNKGLSRTILRLAEFFSAATCSNSCIECSGD